MSNPIFLTQSRFKLATESLTKLFYTGMLQRYQNLKQQDIYLAMLADGSCQVGELAKCFYPHGV